jgi:Ca-activated chloride channel family protein
MSFFWIHSLWLLLFIPLLVYFYISLQRRKKRYTLRYASLSLIRNSLSKQSGIRRFIPPCIFLISLIAVVFALARPVATMVFPLQQGTVILAIDVSGSMSDKDIAPSRLEAAKSAAMAFVEKQPWNIRIGIVSFSTNAALIQTPTTNKDNLFTAINYLKPQTSTAIGDAILASLDAIFEGQDIISQTAFSNNQAATTILGTKPDSTKTYSPDIIILLSDGQSNMGAHPLTVVQRAVDAGVRIYTVGVGRVRISSQGGKGYSSPDELDEETLKQISKKTDGEYFRAQNANQLTSIYKSIGTQLILQPQRTELTPVLTGFAVLLVITAAILSMLWFSLLP